MPEVSSGADGAGGGELTTRTVSREPSAAVVTDTRVRAPGACRTTLASASCTMRYADRSTAGSSGKGPSGSDNSTGTPARTVPSTSFGSIPTPGCGVFAGPPCRSDSSLRSTPSSRRISARDSRAVAAIDPNSSSASRGIPLMRYAALSAWTVITDM